MIPPTIRTLARILILGLGAIAPTLLHGADSDPIVEKTGLKLELVPAKTSYAVGEPIEVTMRYSCVNPDPQLAVWVVTYDRGGRIIDFGFEAEDATGRSVRDPLKYLLWSMGGLRSRQDLTPDKPYEQKVKLNEWLAFDEPGTYQVTAFSQVVYQKQPGDLTGPAIPIHSDPVTLTITLRDDATNTRILAKAKQDLKGTEDEQRTAMEALRFLLDERTLPELIVGLDNDTTQFQAFCGLASLPDVEKMKASLLQRLEQSPAPPPADSWSYINLLAFADQTAAGLDPTATDETTRKRVDDIRTKWQNYVAAKTNAAIGSMTETDAAPKLVDAISVGGLNDPTLDQRRLILRNLNILTDIQILRAPHAIHRTCRDPDLLPELRSAAKDKSFDPQIRSAVLVVLHLLGDVNYRDLIVQDLMAKSPRLTPSAWASLGSYRQEEIADALIRNAQDKNFEVRLKSAELIRDFGTGVSAGDLSDLISQLQKRNQFNSPDLVEALADRSPDDGLGLIRRILRGEITSENDFRPVALRLIARMPGATSDVQKELTSKDPKRRLEMVRELQQAAYDQTSITNTDFSPSFVVQRKPLGNQAVLVSYFPDLLKLASSDPSDEVRAASAAVLVSVSKVPNQNNGVVPLKEIPGYIPQWKNWADGHGASDD